SLSKHKKAVGLVELMCVLLICSILAAIVLPKFTNVGKNARVTAAQADIASFRTAVSMFEVDTGYYPKGPDGLQALVLKPSGAPASWHKYLDVDKIPLDPWGRPYVYEYPGQHNPDGYDIYSLGPDGNGG